MQKTQEFPGFFESASFLTYPSGAGSRSRTGTVSPPVDFESTTSTNSIIPARMIFDENLQKRSLEIGGPFRRPIGNFRKMKSEKVQENQGFASSRAGVDESDFESATSTDSIIPAFGSIIIQTGQNSKGFFFESDENISC